MLRAYSTRTMEKRGSITREEVAFHTSFTDISNSGIFVPQRETGTEYKDISRETTIMPAQCKAKVAAGEWFIYAEPKVTCDAHGIYGLRVKRPPANKPAICRYYNGVLSRLQYPCNPIERLCTPFPRVEGHEYPHPCNLPERSCTPFPKIPRYGYFPKSNFTIRFFGRCGFVFVPRPFYAKKRRAKRAPQIFGQSADAIS